MKKKFLKYPVTNLEDYSKTEKDKLLNAVIFTPKEETFSWWKIIPFILLLGFAIYTIIMICGGW